MTRFPDRYARDVLAEPRQPPRGRTVEQPIEMGMVVEDAETGFCGAVVGYDKHGVTLENRHGQHRTLPLGPGFQLEGRPVALVRPRTPETQLCTTTASGSIAVADQRARVARASRIYVEGKHDAELVEKVWGDDLRVEGVVVEELGGADDLVQVVRNFRPGPGRRLGVLLDHLVPGTKESRIADDVLRSTPPRMYVSSAIRTSTCGKRCARRCSGSTDGLMSPRASHGRRAFCKLLAGRLIRPRPGAEFLPRSARMLTSSPLCSAESRSSSTSSLPAESQTAGICRPTQPSSRRPKARNGSPIGADLESLISLVVRWPTWGV